MKKYIFIFTLFMFLISLTFTACKNNDKVSQNSEISSGVFADGSSNNTTADTDSSLVDADSSGELKSENGTDENGSTVGTNETDNSTTSTKPQNSVSKVPSGSSSGNTSSKNENTSSGDTGNKMLTYKEYLSLSAEKREEYYKTFDSVKAFAKWHEKAKAEYEKEDGSIHVSGNGTLNLEDYY